MNIQLFDLPLKALSKAEQKPFLTKLSILDDSTIYCGAAFDEDLLFHLSFNKKGSDLKNIESLKLKESFGDDALVLANGLITNAGGNTAFVVLHSGASPGFLKGLFGAKWPELDAFSLAEFLVENDGGMGFACRHSVGQIDQNEVVVRRFKESGALVDARHMGDYILGLSGSTVWREGYLEQRIEKRVYVRKDLQGNGQIHRDAADNFWFYGNKNRFYRMKIADIKAKPTFRTLEGPIWTHSQASTVDGWLYGVDKSNKQLFRVRENPVSFEDEMQPIKQFDQSIDSICAVEIGSSPYMLVSVSSEQGCEFYKMPLLKPEDPEFVPDVPELEKIHVASEFTRVKDLTLRKISESQYQIFGLAFGKEAGQSGKVLSLTF